MKKILIIITAAIGCLACGHEDLSPSSGTEEECRYDGMQLKGQWEEIVEEAAERPVQSLACQKVVRLAQYRLGQAGTEAIRECLANTKEVITSETAAMMMSDVYIQLGFASLAQRAAFEAMVKTQNEELRFRALQRLTETAIITRQYDVARKYVAVIEGLRVGERSSGMGAPAVMGTRARSKWLQTMKPMAEHPETIEKNPTFKKLQEQYDKTEDIFFL